MSSSCACGLLAASPAPASAAEAGVNLNGLAPSNVAEASALGAKWVRVFVTWPDLEPARGVHSAFWLAQYDRLLGALPKGTHAILDFVDTPSWESGSAAPNVPPSNPADYAAILHFIAARWAGEVAAYEIWNEEDVSGWWAGGPDPAAYTQLLQAAYPAVKSADPAAEVVLGGLTGNDYNFLQGVYQAGGKGYFDAVGVHTDTACDVNSPFVFLRDDDGRLDQDSFIGYREVHATELANGDEVPIWMTEMSWRTTSAVCDEGAFAGQKPEGVSDGQQATYLAQAYHCMATAPYVQLGLWYPIDDEGAVVSGLLRANRSHKPSYGAMRSFIQRGDQIKGGCGDFAGPKITRYAPSSSERYSGILRIKVKASDSQGIQRIRLLDDGHLIRNFDPGVHTHIYPRVLVAEMHWFGARHIALGHHVLTILAYDKLRNVSRTYVAIVHLPEASRHRHRHGYTEAVRRTVSICSVGVTLSLSFSLSLGLVSPLAQAAQVAQAGTSHVDGISDQSLPAWDGDFSSSYFAELFQNAWVGNPPSHITLARYVVQWNASAESEEGKPAYLRRFESWLRDVSSIGLIPDLALTSYTGSYPSSPGEYQAQLQQLLALAQEIGDPIRYLEAWNEPNNQGNLSASTAADFTNSASAICKDDYGCTVIAGNFEDSQDVARYEEEYVKSITTTPIIWGVHPYYSVEEMSETPFLNFLDHLPDKGIGQQIWFTEISARECSDFDGHQVENGELGQAQRANWLVNTLIKNVRPEHVFYYEFLLKERRQPSCITEAWDGALYLPAEDPGEPDYPRLAASYIWGGTGAARAYIDGAFMTNAAQRTLTGAVAP